jgi:WD40 repeat protein
MGGAGKTVLATALARDPSIQAVFRDGIAWVDAGQLTMAVQLQERLAARLTGQSVSFQSVEMGRHHLANLLADRALLLVVDDVWDPDVLNAIDVVSGTGALLFTTRDRGIARSVGAVVYDVDELTLQQALVLLSRWTDTEVDRLPPVADALCVRVGNLALGVALIGGMIKARGAQVRSFEEVEQLLDRAGVDAIAESHAPDRYKHRSVLASIAVSIDDLPAADRDLYRELAVFATRGSVPPTAAGALWASSGCTVDDTRALLTRLADRSLIQCDQRGWFRLHDLQYDTAARQLAAGPGGKVMAHSRLVEGYRSRSPQASGVPKAHGRDPAVWAKGPDDGYFFENLAFHLSVADRGRELDGLLTSYAWLERKLAVAGINGLLADFSHRSRPADVDAVHGALQLSSHILAHDPGLLAGQLVGRLLGESRLSILALVAAAHSSDGHAWLCPRAPGSLAEPGGPLERTLEGHTSSIFAVAVTADGQHIVSACSRMHDYTVWVWNLTNGRLERTLEGHTNWVRAVAVTADGRRIVSGSDDCTVRVWNLASGRLERTLKGHTGWVFAVAVTADGQRIVSAANDDTVRVWDLARGRLERTLKGHAGTGAVRDSVWDLVSGHLERTLKGHAGTGGVRGAVWDLVVSGRLERTLKGHTGTGGVRGAVWDLVWRRVKRTLEGHTVTGGALAVIADGRRIVCAGGDDTVRVWDLASGRVERTLEGHTEPIHALAVIAGGRRVVSAGDDHTVRVWDLASGRVERTLEGHTEPINALAVIAGGQRIASGSNDHTVRVWDLASGRVERTPEGHTGAVWAVAVTADGQRIVSGGDDCTVRVWDLASGRLERTLEGHTGAVFGVAVRRVDDRAVIVSGSLDCTVRVWDLASGRLERTLEGHTGWVRAVAVTAGGRRIVSGSRDCTVRVWDLASGRLERTLEGHTGWVRAVAVTADGQRIVSGGDDDHTVRVWDLASGRLERTLEGHTGAVWAVAVTADGRRVVSGGGDDHTVRVWDLASGRLECTLEGHTGAVCAVSATVGGRRIVSGGGDHTVRLWDLASVNEVAHWVTDTTRVFSCASHPHDAATMVYGDERGRIVALSLRGPTHMRVARPPYKRSG